MRTNPILITGCHRSGSTFVGRMLSIPRCVSYVHEPFNYTSGCKSVDKWFPYVRKDSPNEEKYKSMISDLLGMKAKFKISSLDETTKSGIDGLNRADVIRELITKPSFSRFARGLLKILFTSKNTITYKAARYNPFRERLLLKDPIACMSSEYLHRQFQMDVVIVVRHPAAFVSSLRKMKWKSDLDFIFEQPDLIHDHNLKIQEIKGAGNGALREGALVWKYLYQVLHRYIERNPAIIPVRYEDLCLDPLSYYQSLYRKLEIPWDSSVELKRAVSPSRNDQRRVSDRLSLRRGAFKSVKTDSQSVASRGKKVLTDEEIQTIRQITEPVASRFYADGDW